MKTGLVLSGGGARGVMHAGVLQAIDEAGIVVECMAGTSAGAIVGALYSYGISPREILDLITSQHLLARMRPSAQRGGFLSAGMVEALLAQYIQHDSFSALRIPVTIAATDIGRGKPVYFDRGPLIRVIAASAAVPVLFAPVRIEDRYYVDGGITDNFPVVALQGKADYIIGAHCNAVYAGYRKGNVRSMMERTMLLAINGNVMPQKNRVDLLIEPEEVGTYSAFAYKDAREIYRIGYRRAVEMLKRVPSAGGV